MARGLLIIRTCSNYWLLCVGDAAAALFFRHGSEVEARKKKRVISRQKTNKPWGVERMRPLVSCVLVCCCVGFSVEKRRDTATTMPFDGGEKGEWKRFCWMENMNLIERRHEFTLLCEHFVCLRFPKMKLFFVSWKGPCVSIGFYWMLNEVTSLDGDARSIEMNWAVICQD